jgi:26S proteasome regulatory subunit N9
MELLRSLVERNAAFFEAPVAEIASHIESRHWFELGRCLVAFLRLEALAGERGAVYAAAVAPLERVLDPFHLAQLLFAVSEEQPSPAAAGAFLEGALPKLAGAPNAQAWLRLQAVAPHISGGDLERALRLLLDIEAALDHRTDAAVRALFYRTRCSLHKARGDHDAFYADALLQLSASGQRRDRVLAFDLARAALCAPGVFSFAELAAHPILECLRGSEHEWLRAFVCALADGSADALALFRAQYRALLRARPAFAPYLATIELKVKLCALQELIFRRPYDARVFAFADVARACAVARGEVEPLVLKALAGGLVEGFIDEVEETVVVTRCRPKALTRDRLAHLKAEIDRWAAVVHERRVRLENAARPVVG